MGDLKSLISYKKYILKGKKYFSKGEYTIALDFFKKASQIRFDSKETHLLEAMSYQEIDGWTSKKAISALYKILSIDPDDYIAKKFIDKVIAGEQLSQVVELYPICYVPTTEDSDYYIGKDEFIANFINDITIKFKIINENQIKIVFCHYDKKHLGSCIGLCTDKQIHKNFVTIPSYIYYNHNKYIVTEIGERAFDGRDDNNYPLLLTGVYIPKTILKIEKDAFTYCVFLKSIKIPNSVDEIESGAFSYCMGLDRIEVEKGNKRYDSRDNCNAIIETKTNKVILGCKTTNIPQTITTIGFGAFHGQREMTEMVIPKTITTIEQSAFLDTGLKRIQIPDSVIIIGNYCFSCTPLHSVDFGNGLNSIGDSAFQKTPNLKTITIPKSVSSIGKMALGTSLWGGGIQTINVDEDNIFYDSRNNCNAIIETRTNTITIGCANTSFPDTIKHIGQRAFFECDSLFEIILPNSIETIGDGAFCYCRNLRKIVLPDSIVHIGAASFKYCNELKEFVIPPNVSFIGELALDSCDNLKSIICKNPHPPYLQSNTLISSFHEGGVILNVTLQVPRSSLEDYKNSPGWKLFENVIAIENE